MMKVRSHGVPECELDEFAVAWPVWVLVELDQILDEPIEVASIAQQLEVFLFGQPLRPLEQTPEVADKDDGWLIGDLRLVVVRDLGPCQSTALECSACLGRVRIDERIDDFFDLAARPHRVRHLTIPQRNSSLTRLALQALVFIAQAENGLPAPIENLHHGPCEVVALIDKDVRISVRELIGDTLLRAADELGWKLVLPPPPEAPEQPQYGSRRHDAPASEQRPKSVPGELEVNGERVGWRIEERMREEVRTPPESELLRERRDYGYRAVRRIQVPTGALRVIRPDTYPTYGKPARQTWYDRKGSRVEDQCRDVLLGFHELSLWIKARRAEDERKRREWHAEEERKKEREARRALGDAPLPVAFQEGIVDFLKWAEGYVDQLDPLRPKSRAGEFSGESGGYHVTELDRLNAAFGRLAGSEWQKAWKVGADYAPEPVPASEQWRHSYREKPVFEVG